MKSKCPDHKTNMQGRPIDFAICVDYKCPHHIGKKKQEKLEKKNLKAHGIID